jgi:hypothetical protein
MKTTRIEVFADKKNQIIKQVIEGDITEEDAEFLTFETEKRIKELDNHNKIDILVYADKIGKPDGGARRILTGNLKRPDIRKIAFINKSPFQRALGNLVRIFSRTEKFKVVSGEEEALSWLRAPKNG